jgi:ABC-type polysaccharide/polyol phosphate export permease
VAEEKQGDAAQAQETRRRMTRKLRIPPVYVTVALLVVVGLLFYLGNPNFLSFFNLNTIISFSAILLMVALGSAIGFRFQNGVAPDIAAVMLTILFGLSLTWLAVFIGISSRDVETAQVAGFVWVFPLVFASSLYVPIETMPSWLQVFAQINPVTPMVDTMRALSLGGNVSASLWKTLAWDGAIILAFLTMALRRYKLIGQ